MNKESIKSIWWLLQEYKQVNNTKRSEDRRNIGDIVGYELNIRRKRWKEEEY